MDRLDKYVSKHKNTVIDYDNVYWHQCVDLIKNYSREVIWERLGTFWWSARSGWLNEYNTFPKDTWNKITYKEREIPEKWDIIFFDVWEYGHVGIVTNADINYIKVFEQNTGNGDWVGYDDRCRTNTYDYSNIYGWYRPINFVIRFKYVPVHYIDQPVDYPKRLWWYNPYKKAIYITPRGRAKSQTDFNLLLEHEWSHHIYWSKLEIDKVEFWEKISRKEEFEENKKCFNKYLWKYLSNKYISPWETNESEDFAETWEDIIRDPNAKYDDYRDIKRDVVKWLMKKYIFNTSYLK